MTTEQIVPGAGRNPLSGKRSGPRSNPVRAEGDLVRDAFRMRATQAIDFIAASSSIESLAEALGAATDFGAIASALGHSAIPAAALTLDPLADALARGAAERERLIARSGGLLTAAQAGRLLGGISRQAIDKRRRAHQLLAVRVGSDWGYPAAQLGPDGQPPALLPALLRTGAALGLSGWVMLDFLLAPDTTLDGFSPLDILWRDGAHATAVLRLLQAAETDAFG
jgi:hypothetical protein